MIIQQLNIQISSNLEILFLSLIRIHVQALFHTINPFFVFQSKLKLRPILRKILTVISFRLKRELDRKVDRLEVVSVDRGVDMVEQTAAVTNTPGFPVAGLKMGLGTMEARKGARWAQEVVFAEVIGDEEALEDAAEAVSTGHLAATGKRGLKKTLMLISKFLSEG